MSPDQVIDMRPQGGYPDLFGYVEGKGIDQEALCRLFADTAGTQVEQGFFAELPYRRPVAAFYVVGIYFELRLGVDGRLIADDQVVVLLKGIGLLRILVDIDLAVEDARGLFEQYAF